MFLGELHVYIGYDVNIHWQEFSKHPKEKVVLREGYEKGTKMEEDDVGEQNDWLWDSKREPIDETVQDAPTESKKKIIDERSKILTASTKLRSGQTHTHGAAHPYEY